MNLQAHVRIQAIIQGCIWFIVGLGFTLAVGFPYLESGGLIASSTALSVIFIATFFAGVLAAVGSIIAIRLDYVKGKITLTPEEVSKAAALPNPRRPYWLFPLTYATVQLLLVMVIAAAICFLISPSGLSKIVFALITALSMSIHGVLVVVIVSGRELLKSVAHKGEDPIPYSRYLWQEHIIGSAFINYGINSLVGYVMYKAGPKHPETLTMFEPIFIDVLAMSIMVSVLTAINSEMQAAGDVPFKLASPPETNSTPPAIYIRLAAYAGMGLIIAMIFGGLCLALGIGEFGVLWIMTIKGVVAAVAAGFAAALGAAWSARKAASENNK